MGRRLGFLVGPVLGAVTCSTPSDVDGCQCFGAIGPLFYSWLIGDGSDPGTAVRRLPDRRGGMIVGGVAEIFLGIDAEGKSLEDVAVPLSAVGATRPRVTG